MAVESTKNESYDLPPHAAAGRMIARLWAAAFAVALSLACGEAPAEPPPAGASPSGSPLTASSTASSDSMAAVTAGEVEKLRVEILQEFPHDRRAFTQGLIWDDGLLYESTGQYGFSSLRRVDPETGNVLQKRPIDGGLFAEGLALIKNPDGDRLVQLTWYAGMAMVWDRESFTEISRFVYEGEGWGLAWNGEHLIMSDGSDLLEFRDPETFEVVSTLKVTLRGKPQKHLNELEIVGDKLYANVWTEDRIVRIDLASGRVEAEVDASNLLSKSERRRADVLNGIAYDPATGDFWITGKYWPKIFRVHFVDAATQKAQ